jgi:hypothetical protein
MSALRVELFWDEEAGNWHYRVPALHINGGGTVTREDAERESLSAIAFAPRLRPFGRSRHPRHQCRTGRLNLLFSHFEIPAPREKSPPGP